jgi:SAM-dependent methyltransferase
MTTLYNSGFYQTYRDASLRSARQVLPFIMEWVKPRSVIDIGCGIGTWLTAFRELGVERVLGVDGEYVNRAELLIPEGSFRPHDLATPLSLAERFDLVMSVEVAEHIPASAARGFVRTLTNLGPVVMFSAAIPHQGGSGHINEQWPEYWAELFRGLGYTVVDCIRPVIWDDPFVEYYYAQNILVFVDSSQLEKYPELSRRCDPKAPLGRVHPRKLEEMFALLQDAPHKLVGPKQLLRALPHSLNGVLWGRLNRLRRRGTNP